MTTTPTIPTAKAYEKVDEFVAASKVQSDIAVNRSDLQEEFMRQPGLIYFYTARAADAQMQTANFKLRLEATEARVASNIRRDALDAGEKTTEATVKEKVRLHPTVVGIEHALIKAKKVEQVLDGVVQSLRHKKDSLMMLGWMERDERNARISVEESLPGATSQRTAAMKQALASRY